MKILKQASRYLGYAIYYGTIILPLLKKLKKFLDDIREG